MKWLVVFGMLSLCGASAWAQSGHSGEPIRLKFRLGRVILMTGDTLDGPVAIQFGPDLLYLAQADGTIRTLAPATLAACAVQQEMSGPASANDADANPIRLFRTLPYASNSLARPEILFFEQLGAGSVLLLRRPARTQRLIAYSEPVVTAGVGVFGLPVGTTNSRGLPPPTPPRYASLTELREVFFLGYSGESSVQLFTGLKDILAAFPQQAALLKAYAHEHRIRLTVARDLAELVRIGNAQAAVPR